MSAYGRPGPPLDRLRLTVAVPTFRRLAALTELLPKLEEQIAELTGTDQLPENTLGGRFPGGIDAVLLVIDNDPERSGQPAVAGSAALYRSEPVPGVVAVRNRALTETSDRDLLVFLDDDQVPCEGWLSALVGLWATAGQECKPGAIAGPVVSVLPTSTDRWIREGGFFDRRYRNRLQTGDRVREVATTNLLLDLSVVRRLDLSFDERFGLSGGEDSLFTRRISAAGHAILWCAEAVVREHLPPGRLTRQWVCHRALSSGNTVARVDLAMAGSARSRARLRVGLLVRGAVRTGSGSVQLLTGLATRSRLRQGTGVRALFRGWGMLTGALDLSYQEYGRHDRRWSHQAWGRSGPQGG